MQPLEAFDLSGSNESLPLSPSTRVTSSTTISALGKFDKIISIIDPHTKLAGAARSLLALGMLLTLTFTPKAQLFFISENYPNGVTCEGVKQYGLFCLLNPHDTAMSYVTAYTILIATIVGLIPMLTSIGYLWLAWSFATSCPVIDGGDQVAWSLAIIFSLFHFGDFRITHWHKHNSYAGISSLDKTLWWSGIVLFIIQGAVIYAHAAIGKFAVPEWGNGTDIWYWMNDPIFAPPEPIRTILLIISDSLVGTVLLNYGILAFEVILAVSFLLSPKLRLDIAVLAVFMHFMFGLSFGLWSFLASMSAVLIMYLFLPTLLLYPKSKGRLTHAILFVCFAVGNGFRHVASRYTFKKRHQT